jgi:hypothetical protein
LYVVLDWIYFFNLNSPKSDLTIRDKLLVVTRLNLSISCLFAFSTVSMTILVSVVLCNLMIMMSNNHKLVFKSHAKKYLAQGLTILISSIFLFVYSYSNVMLNCCFISEGVKDFLLQEKQESGGVCDIIYSVYFELYTRKSGVIVQLAFELLLSLIPVTIFLFTQNPHDCFVCLGKDPDTSAYSIFQNIENRINMSNSRINRSAVGNSKDFK